MGQVIERIAKERGRNCFEKDENNTYEGLSTADVAIDFSVPTAAVSNIPIVFLLMCLSGTTGWLEQYDEMRFAPQKMALSSPVQTLVWASIYSLKSMNI
jgi:4-hydroxy-tetrahydrodipicolinate reductase